MTDGRPLAGPEAGTIGLGWRDATAWLCETSPRVGFVEVIAERLGRHGVPAALAALVERGTPVIPHGVALGLGGAEPPDRARLARLAHAARMLRAPWVSEHVAFVRGGGREVGHLLPVPRTATALAILVDNVRRAQDALPVPLVLENIAALFTWPDPGQLPPAEFLRALVDRTGCRLLLDVSNLHGNACNHGDDADALLRAFPPADVAYLHIAGGVTRDGVYHDTHAHPVVPAARALLARYRDLHGTLPPLLLEHDANFADRAALSAELDALALDREARHAA